MLTRCRVHNNGNLTAEVDGSTTNEIQDLDLTGNNLNITSNVAETTIVLSPYVDADELPSQSGQSGKYLTTDGTNPSWVSPSAGGTTVTTISANTTLSNGDQIVFISDGFIATFPASPTGGMKLVVCSTNGSAGINGNGKPLMLGEVPYMGNLLFATPAVNAYMFYYSSTLGTWFGA